MSLKKTRPADRPYEVWQGPAGFEWKVRKFYKTRENTLADPWARVFCDVSSHFTHGSFDSGDVYYNEITSGGTLVSSDYGDES